MLAPLSASDSRPRKAVKHNNRLSNSELKYACPTCKQCFFSDSLSLSLSLLFLLSKFISRHFCALKHCLKQSQAPTLVESHSIPKKHEWNSQPCVVFGAQQPPATHFFPLDPRAEPPELVHKEPNLRIYFASKRPAKACLDYKACFWFFYLEIFIRFLQWKKIL